MNPAILTIWGLLIPVFYIVYRRTSSRQTYSNLFVIGIAVIWPLIEIFLLLKDIGELWDDY